MTAGVQNGQREHRESVRRDLAIISLNTNSQHIGPPTLGDASLVGASSLQVEDEGLPSQCLSGPILLEHSSILDCQADAKRRVSLNHPAAQPQLLLYEREASAHTMKFSKEHRIITLLVIDTIFFFVVSERPFDRGGRIGEADRHMPQEIITGYMVHSLALVADSFHMLNDVFSLVIALWAIKVGKKPSNSKNSYGWQRAEILGALVNGTFLLALCLSIFMEAIQRFFSIDGACERSANDTELD